MESPFKREPLGSHPRRLPERQVSGVHEAQTQPAPHLEEHDRITTESPMLVGSVPVAALSLRFEPVVCLGSGETFAYEVHPTCEEGGFADAEELFARAKFEHRVGELGRVLRSHALERGEGHPLLLSVHPDELKEGWLIRPDDPLSMHAQPLYLQLAQPAMSTVSRQVLREVTARGEVSIVLDDFGDGPSTISQLVELRPAMVRLSSSLVAGIDSDPRRCAAVEQVAVLCGTLGATVIARGVESEAALTALVECGVGFAQGPILGAPHEDLLPGRLP